jgi:spoIIIJ-associated protein
MVTRSLERRRMGRQARTTAVEILKTRRRSTMSEPQSVDDGGRRVVEVEARTVDEAVARGLVRLGGLSRAEVKIEVVSEGRGGLLGFGAEHATVRLTELLPGESPDDVPSTVEDTPPSTTDDGGATDMAPSGEAVGDDEEELAAAPLEDERPSDTGPQEAPTLAPADAFEGESSEGAQVAPSEETMAPPRRKKADGGAAGREGQVPDAEAEKVAREVVGDLLRLLGYEDAVIELKDSLLPVDIEGESSLVLSVKGAGTEKLLEQEARPLYALQFVSRLMVGRRIDNWVNLLLDIEGDRARRMQELFQLAEQSATLVEREGLPVSLPPMSAYERRVVHLALRDHPSIVTQSIGSGESRKVTVRRKDQILPEL